MISLQEQHQQFVSNISCFAHDFMERPSTPETIPGALSSASSSEFESDGSPSSFRQRAGEASPSAVCQQRNLSAAIVTAPDVDHAIVSGRVKIPVAKLPTPVTKKRRSSSTRVPPQLPFPASSPTAVARPQRSFSSDPSQLTSVTSSPEALRLDAWEEPDATTYSIRGETYLSNKKKVASAPSVMKLLTVDLVQSSEPIMGGLCSHPDERIQTALRLEQKTGVKQLPEFVFAVNLAIPGSTNYHLVAYMGTDDIKGLKSDATPWGRIANKFFFGESDDYRSETFKLIPRIVDGSFVVKKAVGSRPSILGKKLEQSYIRHERFMELIVDIGSNSVANKIVQLSKGYAKSLVVDIMFVLEGKEENTLPERVMGGLRLKNVDFKERDGQRVVHNY